MRDRVAYTLSIPKLNCVLVAFVFQGFFHLTRLWEWYGVALISKWRYCPVAFEVHRVLDLVASQVSKLLVGLSPKFILLITVVILVVIGITVVVLVIDGSSIEVLLVNGTNTWALLDSVNSTKSGCVEMIFILEMIPISRLEMV
jgi:hypothetical protein